jgi:hypothetical protein
MARLTWPGFFVDQFLVDQIKVDEIKVDEMVGEKD